MNKMVDSMFDEFAQKIKGAAINVALKYMSKKDKLSQLFFTTMASNIAPIVLLPASHTVWKKIHDKLKHAEKHGMIESGSLGGVRITLIRTGVGTPSMANVMEVLKEVKPKAIIRVDYAGSLLSDIPVGAVFLATAAIPGDGTSIHYISTDPGAHGFLKGQPIVGDSLPDRVYSWMASCGLSGAVPCDQRLLELMRDAAKARGVSMVDGTIWTTDGLFTESKEKVAFWASTGAKAVDMETSCLYLIARQAAIPAIAVHGISDNVMTQKPFYELEHFDAGIETAIDKAISLVEATLPRI
jgi:purine-nucleoside phosphorylase